MSEGRTCGPSSQKSRRHRGAFRYLFAENDSEFTGHPVDLWAHHHGVQIDFSWLGKATSTAVSPPTRTRSSTDPFLGIASKGETSSKESLKSGHCHRFRKAVEN
jgi:hypothetical protein